MAMIKCPECSHEISDQAVACPHCGYPLHTPPSAASLPAAEVDARLREALLRRGKIMAIKLCRDMHPGMGLADAKQKVEALEAAGPLPTSPSPTASPTVTTTTGCLSVLMGLVFVAGCCFRAFL